MLSALSQFFRFLHLQPQINHQIVGCRRMAEVLAAVVRETVFLLLLRRRSKVRRHVHAVCPCAFGRLVKRAVAVHSVGGGRQTLGVVRGRTPTAVFYPTAGVGGVSGQQNCGERIDTNGVDLGLRTLVQTVLVRQGRAGKSCRRECLFGVNTRLFLIREQLVRFAVAAAEITVGLVVMIERRQPRQHSGRGFIAAIDQLRKHHRRLIGLLRQRTQSALRPIGLQVLHRLHVQSVHNDEHRQFWRCAE